MEFFSRGNQYIFSVKSGLCSYDTIFSRIKDTKIIVTKFGILRYDWIPMGMRTYGGIFQAKVDGVPCDINGFNNYIYYIMVLINDNFYNNIEQIRVI